MMSEFASTQIIEVTYLIASALFILSLKWMSSPATARRGVWAGEAGMLLAIAGTLLHHGIVDYKWLAAALVLGTIIGIPLGKVAMTGGAAADGAEPRVRRAVRDAGGDRGILSARAGGAEIHDGGSGDGSDSRIADVHGKLDGRGKIAGSFAAAADHLQGPEHRQPDGAGDCRGGGGDPGDASGTSLPVPADRDPAADFWRADDYSHWRRGHAHGDFAFEFLRRTVGGGDGLCAGQQVADHRRRAWMALRDLFCR